MHRLGLRLASPTLDDLNHAHLNLNSLDLVRGSPFLLSGWCALLCRQPHRLHHQRPQERQGFVTEPSGAENQVDWRSQLPI
jgi:hypothetical protein